MNWELKLLVASLFATSASFGPFFSLFMQDKGFDALQIGSMISFSRTVMLVSTPAVCAYADRRGVHRGLLSCLAFAAGLVMLILPAAGKGDVIAVGAIFALYSMCAGSKLAICDTIVLHGCKGKADKYPLQRLWGSIAWGVVAMLIGLLMKYYHESKRAGGEPATYELIPLIHAFFQFCFAAVLILFIPPTTTTTSSSSAAAAGVVVPPSSASAINNTTCGTVVSHGVVVGGGGTVSPGAAATAAVAHGPSSSASAAAVGSPLHEASEGFANRGVCSVDVSGPLSSFTAGGSHSGQVGPTVRGLQNYSAGGVNIVDRTRNGVNNLSNTFDVESQNAAGTTSRDPTTSAQQSMGGGMTSSTPPSPSLITVLRNYTRLSRDRRIFFPVVLGVSILSLSEVAMNNFLFPYLRRALRAPPELFSYVLAIHALSEVVAFKTGSYFVSVLGPQKMLIMSSVAFATKAVWYSILEDPWSLLYVESLHGICFAMMWTAAVAHVSKISEHLNGVEHYEEGGGGKASVVGSSPPPATGDEGNSSSSSSSHSNTMNHRGGQAKAESCVRAASMAMTTLWFFANGLPNILGGVLSGYVVQHAEAKEIALFQLVAVMAVTVGGLFGVYGTMGCFTSNGKGLSAS